MYSTGNIGCWLSGDLTKLYKKLSLQCCPSSHPDRSTSSYLYHSLCKLNLRSSIYNRSLYLSYANNYKHEVLCSLPRHYHLGRQPLSSVPVPSRAWISWRRRVEEILELHWQVSTLKSRFSILDQDAPYGAIAISKQFSQVTHENSIKWEATEPQPGVFNFAPADALVNWTLKNNKKIHGHTLVWRSQLAVWVTANNYTCDGVEGHP